MTTKCGEGTAEVILADGQVAVTGQGRYLKLPIEQIVDLGFPSDDWLITPRPDDPEAIDL